MPHIDWTPELEIGIDVIDGQHHRIVDYINELGEVADDRDRQTVGRVIGDLIDYTFSHFAFEEALMEEAGYDSLAIHQNTHEAFRRRIDDFKQRFDGGEDVAQPLATLLKTWLIEHIMSDDVSYAGLVREKMPVIRSSDGGSWLGKALRRFFPH